MTSPPPPPGQPYYPQYPLQPAPKKRNTGLIVGIAAGAAVLALLLCCGGLYALGANSDEPQARDEPAAVTVTTTAPTPAVTTAAPKAAPTTAAPSPTASTAKTVTMPKLTGKNAAVAYDDLTALGFTQIQLGSQDRDDTVVLWPANWTVTKQSTKAGAKVRTDALVVLTCTKQA